MLLIVIEVAVEVGAASLEPDALATLNKSEDDADAGAEIDAEPALELEIKVEAGSLVLAENWEVDIIEDSWALVLRVAMVAEGASVLENNSEDDAPGMEADEAELEGSAVLELVTLLLVLVTVGVDDDKELSDVEAATADSAEVTCNEVVSES